MFCTQSHYRPISPSTTSTVSATNKSMCMPPSPLPPPSLQLPLTSSASHLFADRLSTLFERPISAHEVANSLDGVSATGLEVSVVF